MDKRVREQISGIIASHRAMLEELESAGIESIVSAAAAIGGCLGGGGTVYICGNGGSAADAQHIAGELVGRFRRDRQALAAVALSTDTSVLTSIANDYSYERVFARQVEALVREGDILWALSTSGSSTSIVEAAREAKVRGALVVAFTGIRGSKLESVSDICFCAASESTARSQEIHQLAYHIICELVEEVLFDPEFGAGDGE